MPVLNAAGQPLSCSALSGLFNDVIKQSRERQPYAIGIVSSDKRDRWAEIYEQLEGNSTNSSHLATIEDALFVVCLDQESEPEKGYSDKDEQARQASSWSQFGKEFNDDSSLAEGRVKRLDFELTDTQITQIMKSGKKMDRAADDIDVAVYSYKRYGKNYPKSVNVSPDSFIQMAFQLAFFRIHSALPPTYETATLRKFDEGRTENIRSPNTLAEKFVRKMASGREPVEVVYDALKAAADSHKKYTLSCMTGAGMDRHLLAWKLLAAENGLPNPSILDTSAYEHMAHFQVSTSQVPTRNYIQLCFGPSAPDCYGICYNPQETELHFTVTSFRSFFSTSSKRLVEINCFMLAYMLIEHWRLPVHLFLGGFTN
ncbi:Choline/Carnitine O-acyltransferase [Teladorsagia circumcincta]|uniref:Choline/Carnitine O-acyltransferase n=1 Tax=Teladorsagia circumcincta TaxID=45464 RepID=A0A2G9TRD5_TELCI|nr:Choline/Carnitine O-acyltransferase [Teladorsagia circumcincta]